MVKANTNITFNSFSNPEIIAYCLGFLWGDGCLKAHKMKFHKIYYPYFNNNAEDFYYFFELMKNFSIEKPWICHEIKPKTHTNKYGRVIRDGPALYAIMFDKSIGNWLFNLGYLDKSRISPSMVLSNIPEQYHSHFWRGLVDADGCFSIKGKSVSFFSITASRGYDWCDIEALMVRLGIVGYKIRTVYVDKENSGYSALTIRNCHDIKILGDYLYNNSEGIRLERKYDIYCILDARAKSTIKKTSKYRGVSFDTSQNKWVAIVQVSKKSHFLGRFNTEEEANDVVVEFRNKLLRN
jgi:dipeptidyl aminopeptidase/acylaminoacyl peptidase